MTTQRQTPKEIRRSQVNFRLDKELAELLQMKCDELGVTQSEFTKRAIKAALGLPVEELPVRPKIDVLEEIREEFRKHIAGLEGRLSELERQMTRASL